MGGDLVLLHVMSHIDKETVVLSLTKRRDTQQPTAEAREKISYSYALSLKLTRDTQQSTREVREETVYSYTLCTRWTQIPQH